MFSVLCWKLLKQTCHTITNIDDACCLNRIVMETGLSGETCPLPLPSMCPHSQTNIQETKKEIKTYVQDVCLCTFLLVYIFVHAHTPGWVTMDEWKILYQPIFITTCLVVDDCNMGVRGGLAGCVETRMIDIRTTYFILWKLVSKREILEIIIK